MNEIWIPAILAALASALASVVMVLVVILLRRMIIDNKKIYEQEIEDISNKIDKMKIEYLPREMHLLICGKQMLEIEKLFRKCLNESIDVLIKRIDQIEDSINGRRFSE